MSDLILRPVAIKSGTGLKRFAMRLIALGLLAKTKSAANRSDCPLSATTVDFQFVCCGVSIAQRKSFVIKLVV